MPPSFSVNLYKVTGQFPWSSLRETDRGLSAEYSVSSVHAVPLAPSREDGAGLIESRRRRGRGGPGEHRPVGGLAPGVVGVVAGATPVLCPPVRASLAAGRRPGPHRGRHPQIASARPTSRAAIRLSLCAEADSFRCPAEARRAPESFVVSLHLRRLLAGSDRMRKME